MKENTRCGLLHCVKENRFCVFYLVGLTAALAFVTSLMFGSDLLIFGLTWFLLLLLVSGFLKVCSPPTDRGSRNGGERGPTREEV